MNTLFDYAGLSDHWKECLKYYEDIGNLIQPENNLKYDILCKCITAFCLARSFYSGCYGSHGRFDSEDERLVYIGHLAESFRAVFFRIGMDRLGTTSPGPNSRQQALNELESCWRWLKRKGLKSYRVYRYNRVEGSQQSEWVEVKPAEFVSNIIDAYKEGKDAKERIIQRLIQEGKIRNKKRGDKYDPENAKEATA